jgi:adenine-specific DNA-methyltransferase
LTAQQIAERSLPPDFFKPILPSPRYLPVTEISSDDRGNPLVQNPLFLLDCRLPEADVERQYPTLWRYFQEGRERGVATRYLCQHRSPWYAQENRPPAPFLCTYLGRGNVKTGRPFRFILNQSRATVTNVYLALYPKRIVTRAIKQNPSSARRVWEILSGISPASMLAEGRVYGGGLHKLEPKELANVPALDLADFLPEPSRGSRNGELFS